MTRLAALLLAVTLTACAANPTPAPVPAPPPVVYDLWDYLGNDHSATLYLWGTHALASAVSETQIVYMKTLVGFPLEHYDLVGDDIVLTLESGVALDDQCQGVNTWLWNDARWWAPAYRWAPRWATDGQVFQSGGYTQYHAYDDGPERRQTIAFPSYPIRAELIPTWEAGGTLGTRAAVIALHHYWKTRAVNDRDKEIYYYDREYGLIEWRDLTAGVVTGRSVFNETYPGETFPQWPTRNGQDGFAVCEARPWSEYDGRLDGPVHGWFELSYARYLTIPRSVLQSMPIEWQDRFVECLQQLDEALPWRPHRGRYFVQLRGEHGPFQRDPLGYYRHAPVWTPEMLNEVRGR